MKLASHQNLLLAWQKVKKKDSAGGIDDVSVKNFAKNESENINLLRQELLSQKYAPEPYKLILIDKDNGEKRKIALLSVKDKIVQTAIKQVIEPVLERKFLDTSYAYRANKNTEKAVRRVRHIASQGKKHVARCDIDNFFDEINHQILFDKLLKVLRDKNLVELIRKSVLMGDVNNAGKWQNRKIGIPQGGILSPLLANFYLQPLDFLCHKNKYGYVRYADDFTLLAFSPQALKSALQKTENFLNRKLKLKLNPEKIITNAKVGFEFLGITIYDKKFAIGDDKKTQILKALAQNIYLKNNRINKKFRETNIGIKNYYAKLVEQEQLETLDQEMIELLTKFFAEQVANKKIETQKQIKKICKAVELFAQKNSSNKQEIFSNLAKNAFKKTENFNAKKIIPKPKTAKEIIKLRFNK